MQLGIKERMCRDRWGKIIEEGSVLIMLKNIVSKVDYVKLYINTTYICVMSILEMTETSLYICHRFR